MEESAYSARAAYTHGCVVIARPREDYVILVERRKGA